MVQEISNTKNSRQKLEKLISSGYYKGKIQENSIDLTRTGLGVNVKIIGKLNLDGNFDIKAVSRMSVFYNPLLFTTLALIIFLLFQFNWIPTLVLIALSIFFYWSDYSERKKEINYFMDRFLSIDKTQ